MMRALVRGLTVTCFAHSPFALQADETHFVRVLSGDVSGRYFSTAAELCRSINRARFSAGIWCSIEASAGSSENVFELERGGAEFAIVQADVLQKWRLQSGAFGIEVILPLYLEKLHVVVQSSIEDFDFADLLNFRLGIGELASGTSKLAEALFETELSSASVRSNVSFLSPRGQVSALCEDRLDAFLWISGVPNSIVEETLEGCAAKLIDVPKQSIEKVAQADPVFSLTQIQAYEYPDLHVGVITVGVPALLVARGDVPDYIIDRVTSALERDWVGLQRRIGGAPHASFLHALIASPVALHPIVASRTR